MHLRRLHRVSACLVAAFAALHIANHLVSLASIPTHLGFMEAARALYRHPLAEGLLLASVGSQGLSGLWLVFAGWKRRRGLVGWLQAASGLYLALFLLIHVAAIVFGRSALGLDTNFFYAAAGLHVQPFGYFFVPYYFLAVVALFTHLGCVLYARGPAGLRRHPLAVAAPALAGTVISLLIVFSLAGRIQPFEVPEKYLRTYLRASG